MSQKKARIPEIIPPVPEIPNTGEQSNSGFFIGLGAIAIGGFVSAGVIYVKKKKDEQPKEQKPSQSIINNKALESMFGSSDESLKKKKII